jgi:hypothetical protein
MNKDNINQLGYILIGSITSSAVGSLLLQAVGALVLGILGAGGGYLFAKIIKPKLDKWIDKKKEQ